MLYKNIQQKSSNRYGCSRTAKWSAGARGHDDWWRAGEERCYMRIRNALRGQTCYSVVNLIVEMSLVRIENRTIFREQYFLLYIIFFSRSDLLRTHKPLGGNRAVAANNVRRPVPGGMHRYV